MWRRKDLTPSKNPVTFHNGSYKPNIQIKGQKKGGDFFYMKDRNIS